MSAKSYLNRSENKAGGFSYAIKTSINGDEYLTPQNVVDLIVPYILKKGYRNIWAPFDKPESKFVTTFQKIGLAVKYGHIETGQDFFEYMEPIGEIVVSNPPFSKREAILEKLYGWDIPFALVINSNGLFDSKGRRALFKKHEPQILIPDGRMKFFRQGGGILNSPNFQSVYLCHRLLDKQIQFSDMIF